jgi:hypothetical protein
VTLRTLAEMTTEDCAQAAKRLLDDPLAMGLLEAIEGDAVNAMIVAPDDRSRREGRDTVLTVRGFRQGLERHVKLAQEARHEPKGIV